MIGMRPCECWTAMRISSLCSSKLTVGDSPVVPTTTMPSVPSATCQSMAALKLARSRLASSRIGVMIATRLPVIMRPSLVSGRDSSASNMTPARAEALDHRRLRTLDISLLEGDGHERAEGAQQLARLQEECGIRGPAVLLVAGHERFIDEHAVFSERRLELRQERPVQIVRDDDGGEAPLGEGPRRAALEIGLDEAHAGYLLRLAIHGEHFQPALGEKTRMAPGAAGEIEHRAA